MEYQNHNDDFDPCIKSMYYQSSSFKLADRLKFDPFTLNELLWIGLGLLQIELLYRFTGLLATFFLF